MEDSANHSAKGIEGLIARESKRLLAFIRQAVAEEDAKDLLQDVLFQLSSNGTDSIEHEMCIRDRHRHEQQKIVRHLDPLTGINLHSIRMGVQIWGKIWGLLI